MLANAERNQEIRKARQEGAPYEAIAAKHGLSATRIYYICHPEKKRAREKAYRQRVYGETQ